MAARLRVFCLWSMKQIFVTFALLLMGVSANAQTSYSRYDVNGDHQVNVSDVTVLVNIILGTTQSTSGDVNGDEAVNVNDVTVLVDYILGKRMINGHEFVDLGLPSGTLWATQNMGATSTNDAGSYYAWGEIQAKTSFNWSNYSLCGGSETALKKYNFSSDYGPTIDNLYELVPEDDAAHVLWGALWQMPTREQALELRSKCTWVKDDSRGGYIATGPNGNSVFFPFGGYFTDKGLVLQGVGGYFWSSTLSDARAYNAFCMQCGQSSFNLYMTRAYGLPIRPVAK